MMTPVIADTSGLYAIIDSNDPNHACAARYLKSLATSGAGDPQDPAGRSARPAGRLVISNHVFDEVMTLTKARLGIHVAMQLGLRLRNSRFIEYVIFSAAEEQEAWRIFGGYSDKAWSYTDCACLALARQRGLQQAFSFDHRFAQMGLVMVP